MLRTEGVVENRKRTYRVYSDLGMQVRTKRRRKLVRPRVPMAIPSRPNERWSADFVHDQLADASWHSRFENDVIPGRTSDGMSAGLQHMKARNGDEVAPVVGLVLGTPRLDLGSVVLRRRLLSLRWAVTEGDQADE